MKFLIFAAGGCLRIMSNDIKNKRNIRKICMLLSVMISVLFASAPVCAASASAVERQNLPIQSNETKDWPAGPKVSSESAILMDADSHAILYAKNIHEHLYPASTTKLLTCLIAAENGNLDDVIEASEKASKTEGSSLWLEHGEKLTLRDLLYGVMLVSGNDATVAVAEHIAGSVDAYAKLMTKKAHEIGAVHTSFTNSSGLPDPNHYSTAHG